MSDREDSPVSYQSDDLNQKQIEQSPLRTRLTRQSPDPARHETRGRSFSRSRSPSNKKKMSYKGERGRYRSRSRSRSPRRTREYSRSRSRSRSRGRRERGGGGGGDYSRNHSCSPLSNRRRHIGTRDNPTDSRCLGVFGLSIYTTEHELNDIFSKFGPLERVQVVIDAKTGRSRGFAFVYFNSIEDSKVAKDRCSGMEIDGRRIRVDYSITQRAHTPTPGVYMGKPTEDHRGRSPPRGGGGRRRNESDSHGDRYRERERYRRSPSPYYSQSRSRRYERSRSRSYSRNESRGIG